jgi:signal transduction histidine kinase
VGIALAATLAFMEAYHRLGLPPGPEPAPLVVVLFLATVQGHRALAIAAATAAAVMVTVPDWDFADLPQVLPALAVVLTAGELARVRRAYLRQSRQRAVDAERLRISRELHDVLVHHMSVINVHAGAAMLRPAHATEALGVIRQASRDAMPSPRCGPPSVFCGHRLSGTWTSCWTGFVLTVWLSANAFGATSNCLLMLITWPTGSCKRL